MQMDLNTSKNRYVPYKAKVFYMFMMFLWVASVSPLTGFNFGNNPILMPVYLFILFLYYCAYCKKKLAPLSIFVISFFLWYVLNCFKYGSVQSIQFQPLYSIVIAHVAFNIYSVDEFIKIFERVLVKLCILSLVVWVCANIIGTPFVKFMHAIAVVENQPPTETYSFLVGLGSQFELGLRRNIGFTWEPGKFSCWILLGIYLNLIRNNFVLSARKNKSLYILLATLLTTLSTTGYAVLAINVLFVIINKKNKLLKIFVVVVCVLVVPTIWALPFMREKFLALMDLDAGFREIEYYNSVVKESIVCPQRFTGAYMSFQNFIHDFWLGFNQLEKSYASAVIFKGAVIVAPSEGIINVFAKYGFFVGMAFYCALYKSSKLIAETLRYKGQYIFALFFLAMSFSYDFWENCILMFFYLSAYYKKFDSRYFEKERLQ